MRFTILKMITITLNGESKTFDDSLKVAELLEILNLQGKRVALELNGAIVPKSQHGETLIQNGDVLELVVAVGGG